MADEQQTQQTAPQAPKKKSNKTLWIILGVIGGLFACVIIVAGVGLFVTKKAVDKGVEELEHQGKKLGVEKNDKGNYEYKGKDSSSESGDNVEVPKDWPADVAVYEGNVKSATNLSGGKSMVITISTPDDKTAIIDYYKKNMKSEGWTESSSSNYSGTTSIMYQRDNYKRTASITVGADYSDKSKSMITLTVGKS